MIPGNKTSANRTLLSLLSFVCFAFAQSAQAEHHSEPIQQVAAKAALPEGKTEIRLPLALIGNHIVLPISVNGSKPIDVILDSGMPMPGLILFDTKISSALPLSYSQAKIAVGGTGGDARRYSAQIAAGVGLAIGTATLPGVTIMALPSMQNFALPQDGVIGASIFRNFTVHIDHDAGEFVLSRPGTDRNTQNAVELPLKLRGNLPYVEVQLGMPSGEQVPLDVVLDFGASHTISLNCSTNSRISLPEQHVRTRIGHGLSGPVLGHAGRVAGLSVGGYHLEQVIATFPDPAHEHPRGIDSRDGNLGMGILSRFNITVDYAKSRVFLQPNKNINKAFEWDMSGLILEAAEDNGLKVVAVLSDSPAETAGIKVGDLVISAGGEPVTRRDARILRERFERDGSEVPVTIVRNNQASTVQLLLRRLI